MYKETIIEVRKSLSAYVSIKKQFKELIGKGKMFSNDVAEKYEEMKVKSKALDALGLKFRELMKDRTVAYSAKLARTSIILKTTKNFVEIINEMVDLL